MDVQGHCDDRFAEVAEEFATNLRERGEIGASCAVTVGGETVVDLWGGHADPLRARSWDKDTICPLQSCTKGVTALAAHLLAADGQLDFDQPVSSYWPEFAAAGKGDILVRHLLSHQAGLPALREPVREGGFYDWDYIVGLLAAEEPWWAPGTRYGYHAYTFGYLVGEVIRRVTGRDFGEFVAAEITGPLELDLWIGLPESEHHRTAELTPPPMPGPGDPISRFTMEAMTQPDSLPGMVLGNTGGYTNPGEYNAPAALSAVLPSVGAVGNGRALAGLYRAIVHDRVVGRFALEPGDITAMGAVQSAASADAVLHGPGRWTLGFHKQGATPAGVVPPLVVTLSEEAFGHTGAGGSIGFADPGCDMSFGYVMNQQALDMGLGPTGQSLVNAVYRALGYQLSRYATWVR